MLLWWKLRLQNATPAKTLKRRLQELYRDDARVKHPRPVDKTGGSGILTTAP